MIFKNLKLYKLNPNWTPSTKQLHKDLKAFAFVESNFSDSGLANVGWEKVHDEYESDHELVLEIGSHLIAKFKYEKKLLPAAVINQYTKEKAQEIEEQQGFKLSKKKLKELKESVTDKLRPKAFSVFKEVLVVFDIENSIFWMDTSSTSLADDIVTLLSKCTNPLPLSNFQTAISPTTAMTKWVVEGAPSPFSTEQDTELKGILDSKVSIKYANHSPDIAEVRNHLNNGKICTRLSLNWDDKIIFTLNESLDIKKITVLNIKNDLEETDDKYELFLSEIALMVSELSNMINDLSLALSDEHNEA